MKEYLNFYAKDIIKLGWSHPLALVRCGTKRKPWDKFVESSSRKKAYWLPFVWLERIACLVRNILCS